MTEYLRRGSIGFLAGLASSIALVVTHNHSYFLLIVGAIIGIAYSILFRSAAHAYIDSLMTAAALGFPIWSFLIVILIPLSGGKMPQWTAEEMRSLFPQLVGGVVFGAGLGLITQALHDVAPRWLGPEAQPSTPVQIKRKHIVVLGGGFGGMTTAESLEKVFRADRSVKFTLISETNALLFTPMLAEVAGSSLERPISAAPCGRRYTEPTSFAAVSHESIS
jgi:NADH:ubiquinone reductase (H+-translocating)